MTEPGRPLPRVRVTAPRASGARLPPTTTTGSVPSAIAGSGSEPNEVEALFVRSLIRSQLRLAVVCAVVFGALLAGLGLAVALLPALAQIHLVGVPLSWLVLAAGAYPLVIVTAVIFDRAARRNEAGYRSLSEDS